MERDGAGAPAFKAADKARGGRVAVVVLACLAVTTVGASIVNRSRFILRCEDGKLLAYRGLSLPLGSGRLDPDTYPAVEVPPMLCEDITVSTRRALEQHYLDATVQRIDTAIQSDDADQLESAARAVEQLVGSPGGASEVLADRKRALIVALLRADLRGAQAAIGRARGRLRAAENAGVSPEVLAALRSELEQLGAPPPTELRLGPPEPAPPVDAPEPEPPPPSTTATPPPSPPDTEGRAL